MAKNGFGDTGHIRLDFAGRSRFEDTPIVIPEQPLMMNDEDYFNVPF